MRVDSPNQPNTIRDDGQERVIDEMRDHDMTADAPPALRGKRDG